MCARKGNIFMTNIYISPRVKRPFIPVVAETKDTKATVEIKIAQEISAQCARPLLISICRMSGYITKIIANDIASKELK